LRVPPDSPSPFFRFHAATPSDAPDGAFSARLPVFPSDLANISCCIFSSSRARKILRFRFCAITCLCLAFETRVLFFLSVVFVGKCSHFELSWIYNRASFFLPKPSLGIASSDTPPSGEDTSFVLRNQAFSLFFDSLTFCGRVALFFVLVRPSPLLLTCTVPPPNPPF